MTKSLIILSHKSCGSSACLRLMTAAGGVRTIAHTRHHANESLYWTKAASILGRPQRQMYASETPIPAPRARQELLWLLRANAPEFELPADDEELVFNGWRALCLSHRPVFVEKSPHHLYQASCLDLMKEAMVRLPDVSFHFLGLIRNPIAVLYSHWQRWRSLPERVQEEWIIAYRNLLRLNAELGERVTLVRYEDMVQRLEVMAPVFAFCGVDPPQLPQRALHQNSVAKWRTDRKFGFALSSEAVDLAQVLGYTPDQLPARRTHTRSWPVIRDTLRAAHVATRPIRRARSSMIRWARAKGVLAQKAPFGASAARPSG